MVVVGISLFDQCTTVWVNKSLHDILHPEDCLAVESSCDAVASCVVLFAPEMNSAFSDPGICFTIWCTNSFFLIVAVR